MRWAVLMATHPKSCCQVLLSILSTFGDTRIVLVESLSAFVARYTVVLANSMADLVQFYCAVSRAPMTRQFN